MRLTKQQAVGQLIDGAIRAYEAGEHACAIVLAGSAEGAMPEPAHQHIFSVTRDAFTGHADPGGEPRSQKEVVTILNVERDWLKHYNPGQPNEMKIDDSIAAVFRAISKFQALYGYEAETEVIKEFFREARRFDPED